MYTTNFDQIAFSILVSFHIVPVAELVNSIGEAVVEPSLTLTVSNEEIAVPAIVRPSVESFKLSQALFTISKDQRNTLSLFPRRSVLVGLVLFKVTLPADTCTVFVDVHAPATFIACSYLSQTTTRSIALSNKKLI
jgi:hypothetical protein